VVGSLVAERRVTSFGVVVGDVVADFQLGFGQAGEAAAVEQFGVEAAPKRFGVGIVIAVARCLMLCTAPCWASKSLNRVAVYWLPWSEWMTSPAGGRRTTRARRSASLTISSGMMSRTSQPTILREQRSSHTAK
jgi:hypothetical protein